MNKDHVLFEYETKKIFSFEENRIECDQKFIELENYLEKISQSKNINPFFSKIERDSELSKRQRILDFNYKDYSISANQFVGVLQMKWCRFTLLPKIFKRTDVNEEGAMIDYASRDLMYLLSYAYDLKANQLSKSNFSKNQKWNFFEVFISLFATQTLQVLEHNFYHHYEEVEENLPFIKGKIIFSQHLKENIVKNRYDRIYCRYEQFQENNLFNQIIKYITSILFHKTKVADNRNLLRKILHLLHDVDHRTCVASDTEKVILNPTQKEFVPILNYCKLFLQNSLIKFNQNNIHIFCFLLDMNLLFEKFVAGFLKQHFSEYQVETQKSDKYVAEDIQSEPVFQMRHDLFLIKDNEAIIIDTKYKKTDFSYKEGGILQADIYQIVTYAIRRKCSRVILLYPKYSEDQSPQKINYFIKDEFSGYKIHLVILKIDLTNLKSEKILKDEDIKAQLRLVLS